MEKLQEIYGRNSVSETMASIECMSVPKIKYVKQESKYAR